MREELAEQAFFYFEVDVGFYQLNDDIAWHRTLHFEICSGLARTVGTNDGDAGNTGRLEAHVEDGRRLTGRVLVRHVRQLHKRLGLRLHPLQRARDRERELHNLICGLNYYL